MALSEEPVEARVESYHPRTGEKPKFGYPVRVLRWRPCHVIVSGVFGPEVEGRSPIFRPGDLAMEFYWSDRWWNVTTAYEPTTGALGGYYTATSRSRRVGVLSRNPSLRTRTSISTSSFSRTVESSCTTRMSSCGTPRNSPIRSARLTGRGAPWTKSSPTPSAGRTRSASNRSPCFAAGCTPRCPVCTRPTDAVVSRSG